MPPVSPQWSVPTDLQHAVASAQPRHTVVSRSRPRSSASRAPHPVVAAIGAPLYERFALNLVGISSGVRTYFGACEFGGRRCAFDFWFPYLGIAVDVEDVDADAPATGRPWARTGRSGLVESQRQQTPRQLRYAPGEQTAKWEWCTARGIAYVAPEDARDVDLLTQLAAQRRGESS